MQRPALLRYEMTHKNNAVRRKTALDSLYAHCKAVKGAAARCLGFEALDVFEGAGDDDVVFGGEDVAGDGEDGFRPALLDGEDVEVIFFADIGGYDVLAHPFFRDGELEDAVVVIQLDEVEDIFRVIEKEIRNINKDSKYSDLFSKKKTRRMYCCRNGNQCLSSDGRF